MYTNHTYTYTILLIRIYTQSHRTKELLDKFEQHDINASLNTLFADSKYIYMGLYINVYIYIYIYIYIWNCIRVGDCVYAELYPYTLDILTYYPTLYTVHYIQINTPYTIYTITIPTYAIYYTLYNM